MENLDDRPYCLPDDRLSFANPVPIQEETDFLSFLGNLKSTADICKPKFGRSCPNENKGKKLSAFSFLNSEERFDLEYYKNRPGQLAELKEDCSGTEAEKTLRHSFYIFHFATPVSCHYTVNLCFPQPLFYVFRHFCFGNFVIFVLCFSPLVVVDNSLPLPVKPTDSCGI